MHSNLESGRRCHPMPNGRDTCTTLHMWVQIVGKIRLALSPWVNHSWGSTLYVTPYGLTTSPMAYAGRTFCIDFDFIQHALRISVADGTSRVFALEPMTVAAFYRKLMGALRELGIEVKIYTRPVEIVDAIRFEDDVQHGSYDAERVNRYWRALLPVDQVFKRLSSRLHRQGESRASVLGAPSTSLHRDSRAGRHPCIRAGCRIALFG